MNKTLTAVAAASLMVFSACGGDDSGSSDSLESMPLDSTSSMAPSDSMPSEDTASGDVPEMEYGSSEAWGTIVDVLYDSEGTAILVEALIAADLLSTLEGAGPLTLLAPTDQAFNSLPEGVLAKLLLPENRDALVKVLTYHLLAGSVLVDTFTDDGITTKEGEKIAVETSPRILVNGAPIRIADIAATNGVVHIIETVLLPPDLDLSTL